MQPQPEKPLKSGFVLLVEGCLLLVVGFVIVSIICAIVIYVLQQKPK